MQLIDMIGETGLRNIQFGLIWLAVLMIAGVINAIILDSNAEYEAVSSGPKGTPGGRREFIRSAHVHGALFSLINIVYGLLINQAVLSESVKNWGSWLMIVGVVLLPLGLAGKGFMPKSPIVMAMVSISSLLLVAAIGIIGFGYLRI